MSEYYDDDLVCPNCHHYPTRARACIHCDDGWLDEYEDDPVNYAPGEEYERCQECNGSGIERWCPECGIDLNTPEWRAKVREQWEERDRQLDIIEGLADAASY